uniref:NADH:ubiquinone reductase (H(+)-translocating) n=1 Tax=Phyllocoptes taishanensis TaxID=1638174 RepID=A0A0U2NR58_9ACAR|nr:NADH dehydrogenase subunit 5 [Phyllocoptes taishanensis]ALK03802.1 NADH dehydrogenase subunit 5 [Phyllocoptes taishanensis]
MTPMFFLFWLMVVFCLLVYSKSYMLSLSYFYSDSQSFNNFLFSFGVNYESLIFTFMVLLVTCMVLSYSEVYMEHYNNNKFIFLLLIFFVSMVLLSLSENFLILMLGWDGLGISSICLIMFYPNKNTLYNSLLTMFFNRLGDVVMIIVLSMFILQWSNLIYDPSGSLSLMVYLMLLICSFTKSAQFPLSSWLPAAMSAPTPISAMVHSSTLVTAGVYVCVKMMWFFSLGGLLEILMCISLCSFMAGGGMANVELDFKKMVAFSTMSQISMIMLFLGVSLYYLALTHMVFHALFKTLLFCCAGTMFIYSLSDQSSKMLANKAEGKFLHYMFFLSIFSMSGLIFSSSFFSKDMGLEYMCSMMFFYNFMFLLSGSLLTLLYCSKMMKSGLSFLNSMKTINFKSSFFIFSTGFLIVTLSPSLLLKSFGWLNLNSFLSVVEVLLILFIFMFSSLGVYRGPQSSKLLLLSLSISTMKTYGYSFLGKFMSANLSSVGFTDSLIFKPFMAFWGYKVKIFTTFKTSIIAPLILIIYTLG